LGKISNAEKLKKNKYYTTQVVITPSPKTPFAMGLEYVAVSRATELNGVVLTGPLRPHHFNSHGSQRRMITTEYRRLFDELVIRGGPMLELPESAVKRRYPGFED
jgi:hypothetical protein